MFDNLREQANSTPFYEDESQFRDVEDPRAAAPRRAGNGHFLGMTPLQRFILAFMFLIAVCVLGSVLLFITGRIGLM